MDRGSAAHRPLPMPVVVAALALVILVAGFFAWRTIANAAEPGRVEVDINKVKEDFQKNGFGGH